MTPTASLDDTCRDLFARYPLAVSRDDTGQSMVLMLDKPAGARFFVLGTEGSGPYLLRDWEGPAMADAGALDVLAHAIPVPADGSLFGWKQADAVTALIPFWSLYSDETPEPCWAVMPAADLPESRWPPFAAAPLLGRWFWDHYQAGNIVDLVGVVASAPGAVFWADLPGSPACCAVARDVTSPDGWVLPRGLYAYWESLRDGVRVPHLDALLADPAKTDLAPWFEGMT